MDRPQWFEKDKKSLGLKYPNLPYLIDGNIKITESAAVIKYIPKRFGRDDLLGKTPEDFAGVQTILGITTDIWVAIMGVAMSDTWKNDLATVWDTKLKDKLVALETNLVGPTCIGYLTIADLAAAPVFDLVFKIYKDKAGEFKKLQSIVNHVHEVPEIKQYREKGVTLVLPPNAKLQLS